MTNATSLTVLNPTQILPPPTNGSGTTYPIAPDAFEVRGGSFLEIMGGQFSGGDANYVGNGFGSLATAGDAIHFRQSTGVIHSGTFTGGNSHAEGLSGNLRNSNNGNALFILDSNVTIYDGSFTGGTNTRSIPPPSLQAQSMEIVNSFVEMYSGTTSGDVQLVEGARLKIYGSNFLLSGAVGYQTITGQYNNGASFTHSLNLGVSVRPITVTDTYILIGGVPEPSTLGMLAIGCVAIPAVRRSRR